jgi:hypothetical protein
MKFTNLQGFIKHAVDSTNPFIQHAGLQAQNVIDEQEDEEIPAAPLDDGMVNKTPQPEDKVFHNAITEMYLPDPNDKSTFGKTSSLWNKLASAYIRDLSIKELPTDTKEDIAKFIPKKELRVIQYGMVVSELLPKVDTHNFEAAVKHIKADYVGKDKEKLKKEFFDKAKDKYILIMNDQIIDGHHFLARAKELGITNSLNVIDLTPSRFQEKKATAYSVLRERYGKHKHYRQDPIKA